MARPKGQPKFGGRQKGTPNKTTATMRQAIAAVYQALQKDHADDHGHFTDWARNNPTEFYRIASKLLPLQVSGDADNPLQAAISVSFVRTDEPRAD